MKRIISVLTVLAILCSDIAVLGVNANKYESVTVRKIVTLFDSDAITPFAKTTGTAYGSNTDSYGTANISGTTTPVADGVRIASVWGSKGASVEMIDEGDRANIIKTAEDGTGRTTLSFGPTYDNASAIKDGDVLELSFDYKFGLNANYNNPNDGSGLVFDTPYRSKMFGSFGGGSLGSAWVNGNNGSGLPQTVTGWGKVSTANGTRNFGPSNDLSWGVGLMDAGKWYNVKITITDPADGTDQKITWTYTALDDGDVIETANSATIPAQKSYTITKTLDMDGTTEGVQQLEKATAFGFTFVPQVDEYYDNIKYTHYKEVTEEVSVSELGARDIIDLDFDTLDASNFVTKTGEYTSGAIEAGDMGYLKYQNTWVTEGNWSATAVDDGNGGKKYSVSDKSGHTAWTYFCPESDVEIKKGDEIYLTCDFTFNTSIGSQFRLKGYSELSLFKIDGADMWQWKNGAYSKDSIGAFTSKNGKGYQFNMPNLNGMGNENGYQLVSGKKYKIEILIRTDDINCPDKIWGNTIDNKQTITFTVRDSENNSVVTWSKAVLDANTTENEKAGQDNNELAKGRLETVDLIKTFSGISFGESYSGIASDYEIDNLMVQILNSGVDAYGEGIKGIGNELEFIPGTEFKATAFASGKPGKDTNFIVAKYDEEGILLDAEVYDLSETDYTTTVSVKTNSSVETVKLYILEPDTLRSNVKTLTLSKNIVYTEWEDGYVELTSTDAYYMHTIDNSTRTIYDYGQTVEEFTERLHFSDNVKGVEFISDQGYPISRDSHITDSRLRVYSYNKQYLDYKVVEGTDADILEAVEDGVFGIDTPFNEHYDGWYEYTYPKDIVTGSALDASFILSDAKTIDQGGFITRQGDKFVDKNGKEIEFWGTNIGGGNVINMTKDELDRAVDRIAKSGFNLVRIHAIDEMVHRMKDIYGNTFPGSFWQGMYSINETTGEVIEQYLYPVPQGFRHMTPAECKEHWHKKAENVELDEEAMDKLCYFVAKLKEKGIYYWMDLMAKRGYYEKDKDVWGIETKFNSPAVYYNENIQAGGKDFSKRLLTWYNPYTNSRLCEDPSLAMVGTNNENALEGAWLKYTYDKADRTDDYYDEICRMYADWLYEKYKPTSWVEELLGITAEKKLKDSWGTNQRVDPAKKYWLSLGLQDYEYLPTDGPGTGYVEVLDPGTVNSEGEKVTDASKPYELGVLGWGGYSVNRINDVMLFLNSISSGYATMMMDFLKNEVGVKCAVTANTTWGGHEGSVTYTSSKTDMMDFHRYHAHPNGGWSMLTDGITGEAPSYLEEKGLGCIGEFAQDRLYNYPVVITEWNDCPFNVYESEGFILMSAYGKLNGWTPLSFAMGINADYFKAVDNDETIMIDGPFSMIESPIKNALFASTAIAFLRNDVTEATTGYYNVIPKEYVLKNYGTNVDGTTIWPGQHSFPKTGYVGLIGKTGVALDVDGLANGLVNDETIKAEADAQYAKNGVGEVYNSVTGELKADMENKVFTMNTERSQMALGFIEDKTITLKDAEINVKNQHAAITITSLDAEDNAIRNSNRILLSVIGKNKNYGQILSLNGEKMIKPGADKVMVEQILGSIKINLTNPNGYKVYSLNSDGSRKAEIPFTTQADGIQIPLTVDLQAMNFEIVK